MANNAVLGVFPIYKVRTYVHYKENGCKRDF